MGYADQPMYSMRDMSHITENWANACRRDFKRGLFWGAFWTAALVTVCRASGWL